MNVLFLLTTVEREQVGRPSILSLHQLKSWKRLLQLTAQLCIAYNIPIKFLVVPFSLQPVFNSESSSKYATVNIKYARTDRLQRMKEK